MLSKQLVAQVLPIYLVRDVFSGVVIVGPRGSRSRFNMLLSRTHVYIRIIKRIDIHRHASTMLRHGVSTRDITEIEARRVVCLHHTLIVSIEIVGQTDAFYTIVGSIEFAEDVQQVLSYSTVTYHLAHHLAIITIPVGQTQVTQFEPGYGTILLVRLSLHTIEYGIGYQGGGERLCRC